jgi:hypothetical protein
MAAAFFLGEKMKAEEYLENLHRSASMTLARFASAALARIEGRLQA